MEFSILEQFAILVIETLKKRGLTWAFILSYPLGVIVVIPDVKNICMTMMPWWNKGQIHEMILSEITQASSS